jgi:hypothetical protein
MGRVLGRLPALCARRIRLSNQIANAAFSDDDVDHEFESLRMLDGGGDLSRLEGSSNRLILQHKNVTSGFSREPAEPGNCALKFVKRVLRFVQRGRILLRCGSAFALSLPSLGVSSLDLGRLFNQAALFSFWASFFHRHSGMRVSADPESRACWNEIPGSR